MKQSAVLASVTIFDNGRVSHTIFPLGSLVVTSFNMSSWEKEGCTLTLIISELVSDPLPGKGSRVLSAL